MNYLVTYPTSYRNGFSRLPWKLLMVLCVLSTITATVQAQNPVWQNCVSNEYVKDIKTDNGTTWVATTGGLIHLNDQLEEIGRYTSLSSDLPCNYIHNIELDAGGILWINHCYGLSSYDGNEFANYDVMVNKMVLDHNKNLILIDNNGYQKWNGSEFDLFALEAPIQYLEVGDAYFESEEIIWVSKYTYGVFQIYRYENGKLTVFDYTNSELPFEYPYDGIFVKGKDDKINIVLGNTVFRYDNNTWTTLTFNDKAIIDIQIRNDDAYALLTGYIDGSQKTFIAKLSDEYTIIPETLQEIDQQFPKVLSISEEHTLVGFLETRLHQVLEDEVTKINLTNTNLISNSIHSLDYIDEEIWVHAGRSEYDRVNSILSFNNYQWEEKKGEFPFLESTYLSLNFDEGLADTTYLNFDRKSFFKTDSQEWSLVSNPDFKEGVDENDVSVYIDIYGNKWLRELYTSNIYYKSPTGLENDPS